MDFFCKLTEDDIKSLELEFDKVLDSEEPLVSEVGNYVLRAGGKRLRPMIMFLLGHLLKTDNRRLVKVAAAIELIHTATLMHDDVIDKGEVRRGRPTVNHKWGSEIAILTADYLFSNAFCLALETCKPEIVNILAHVTNKMCEAEVFQIRRPNYFFSMNEYYSIITRKTACLFGACATIPGTLADLNLQEIATLQAFGLNYGMAFQITDDVLDYIGDSRKCGKPIGNDLREGKQTIPLIYALENAAEEDKIKIIESFNNGRDLNYILKFIKKYNGIDYAVKMAKDFSKKAIGEIEKFPKNEYSNELIKLTESVIGREF